MLLTKRVNGVEICYDQAGYVARAPIVLMSGWAHDMSNYDEMEPYLIVKHYIIHFNWRGHGPNMEYPGDFGVEEQVQDTIAPLEALDVDKFHLVAHSHGGWPALKVADQLGKNRVLSLLIIDQIMSPPPPPFAAGLRAMQEADTWLVAREKLFDNWLSDSRSQAVQDHLVNCMGSYGHDMWSLSCRVIGGAYNTHCSPMDRMRKMVDPPPIRHVFSHPRDSAEYRKVHEYLAKEASWSTYADLMGETHFPTLEIPERVCEELESLIVTVGK